MARLFNDASDEYLEIDSAIITGPPFSVSLWGNIDNDTDNLQTYIYFGDKDVPDHFHCLRCDTGAANVIRATSKAGGGSQAATTATGATIGTTHHIAGVWASASARAAYIDGGSKGTDPNSVSPAGLDRTSIGRMGDSTPTFYLSGHMCEVGIWNIALSDAEVATLAQGFSPLDVQPQNLIAYWRLIRDEDQDLIGGYDLTAYNTPSITTHAPKIISPRSMIYPSLAAVAITGRPRRHWGRRRWRR